MKSSAKVLLDAPYYSQWLDVGDPEWQKRSCGVCALMSAMGCLALQGGSRKKAKKTAAPDLDELIEKGLELRAYMPNVGWIHEGLVNIARFYGFTKSFRKEWATAEYAKALNFIVTEIENKKPVMASVKSPSGGHLILLIGYEKSGQIISGFFMNDPDAHDHASGKNKFIRTSDFLKIWKGRIIVVQK